MSKCTNCFRLLPKLPSSPLQRALIHWHSVHFLIETFADKTISLASVARQDGLSALQFLSDVQARRIVTLHGILLSKVKLTCADLKMADAGLAAQACKLAQRFGFDCDL